MPDAPTPLDLAAIEAAIAACRTYNFGMHQADRLAHEHAPALVEEVKRLRAELDQAAPHITYARGRLDGYRHAGSALLDAEAKVERQRDRLRAREERVRRLRAEVTRLHALVADLRATTAPAWDEDALTLLDEVNRDGRIEYADYSALHDAITAARPAPVWDEEAIVEGMARAVYPLLFTDDRQPLRVFGETRSDAELREGERDVARERMRQALAVVREHLPVKPDREAVARLIDPEAFSDWSGAHDPRAQVEQEARRGAALRSADKVLTLWPGRSDAEVKEEALREAKRAANHDWLAFQSVWGSSPSDLAVLAFANKALDWLHARADRLAAEGGADRG